MKRIILIALIAVFGCQPDDDAPSNAIAGKWKIDKVIYQSDVFSSELNVSAANIVVEITDDGRYIYTEGGSQKEGKWEWKTENERIEITRADNSKSEYDMELLESGLQMLMYELDHTKSTFSQEELDVFQPANLHWLTTGKDPKNAKKLSVFFLFKATQ